MSSLLRKAIAARLRENHEEADRLFHEFVLSRATVVNNALVSGEEIDVDAIVEGKTYKRGKDEDDVSGKKQKDQERKDGAKQKRGMSEETMEEGKTYKRGKDDEEEAGDKKRKDQDRKDGAKQKRQMDEAAPAANPEDDEVTEGQLTATQGDDGTLVIVHDPAGSEASVAPAPAMPVGDDLADAGVDPMLGADDDMDFEDDLMSPDLEVSDDPLPGVDDLNDEAFESLKESLAEDLKTILIDTKDGQYADGGKASQETHSPVPNVAAEDRMDGAEPVEIKGASHNGFDKEPAPKVEKGAKAENTRQSAGEGTKAVK